MARATPVASPADVERWQARAVELLARALEEARDNEDAIASATEALAALYRAQGESPESVRLDAADLEPEDFEFECICPPELVARGGFKSGCRVHAYLGGAA